MATCGRWLKVTGNYMTPGGTPVYICARCGGSNHLHGAEYPKRKIICDNCGRINIYPWETAYEESSTLWDNEPHIISDELHAWPKMKE